MKMTTATRRFEALVGEPTLPIRRYHISAGGTIATDKEKLCGAPRHQTPISKAEVMFQKAT